jgi:hypothetical protein
MGPFTPMRSPEVGTWGGHTDSRCGSSMASTARHNRGQMMPVRVWFYVNTWNSRMMFTAKTYSLAWTTCP